MIHAAVIGLGGRGRMLAGLLRQHDDVAITAIADRDPVLCDRLGSDVGIADAARFAEGEDLIARAEVDLVVVATPDHAHLGPTLAALERGRHVLLEKPMAPDLEACRTIVRAQRASGAFVAVCHGLRHQNGFERVRAMVREGRIGPLISIALTERIPFWHFAHSYVRGHAAEEARSGPMILTKSCHDLDWLCHLVGAPAERLWSSGGRSWFHANRAPAGAPARCTDGCAHEATCPYSALRCYVDTARRSGWPAAMCSPTDHSREAHLAAMRNGPYGRCVWRCTNDVVDHQVVGLTFPGGISATFTVTGLSAGGGRLLRIHGGSGEIVYDQGLNRITCTTFARDETTTETVDLDDSHGQGGDAGVVASLLDAIRHDDGGRIAASAEAALRSHAMAFAAEHSRRSGQAVDLAPWTALEGSPV